MLTPGLRKAFSSAVLALAVSAGTVALGAAAASAQGSLPNGSMSFFNLKACPGGWGPLGIADGRFVIPLIAGAGNGSYWGTALKDGEDRTHDHTYASSIKVANKEIAALGGNNTKPAKKGTVEFSGSTNPASTGLPYVQLLFCQKVSAPDATPVPTGILMFVNAFGGLCPAGWSQPSSNQGRILVGLPVNGTPGLAWGGAPLKPQVEPTQFHQLQIDGTIRLDPHELAIASGCCRDGFGKKGTYGYSGNTDADSAGLAYIMIMQCRKS